MNTRRPWLVALILAFFVPALAAAGSPRKSNNPHDKLDRALQQALRKGHSVQQVIVTAQPGQEAAVRALLGAKGRIKGEHHLVRAFLADLDTNVLESVAQSDAVASLSANANVAALPNSHGSTKQGRTDTLRGTLGLNASSPRGSRVRVAIIDSGIAEISEFSGRIDGFYNCIGGGCAAATPVDDYGHGTHIAGLIGGNGSLSGGQYMGVAPDARLLVLKVLDSTGKGSTTDVMAAIEFVIANNDVLHVDLINLSLGHPVQESADTDPLVRMVGKAVDAGIIVICSAGNFGVNPTTAQPGYGGISSPGNSPRAITVGAADTQNTVLREDDVVAEYSSRGPTWIDAYAKPDIVAPGDRLISVVPSRGQLYQDHRDLRLNPGRGFSLMKLSGTSMAAGVSTGSAALVLDAYRQQHGTSAHLSANAMKALLQFTAVPVTGFDALTQGTGEVNPAGAMHLASMLDFSDAYPMPPNVVIEPRTTIGGIPELWSQNIVWGDNIVSGDNIVWSDNIVWGDNIIWGDNIVWSDASLDNIVWGDNIVWADNIVWGDGLVGVINADGSVIWSGAANIVWSDVDVDNIVWGEVDFDNIVWSDAELENIIWADTLLALFGRVR